MYVIKTANVLVLILVGLQWTFSMAQKSDIACEHAKDDNVELKCPGRRRIHVLSANYGREPGVNSGCSLNRPLVKVCREPKSTQIVQRECEGKKSCTVKAANSVFGDPCRGVVKYLRVKYRCDVTTIACEHAKDDTVNLRCPRKFKINIISANYGRELGVNSGCPLNQPDVKTCEEPRSKDIVKRKCQGKRKCSVKAANSVFGDPCKGVVKYLVVRYRCQRKR